MIERMVSSEISIVSLGLSYIPSDMQARVKWAVCETRSRHVRYFPDTCNEMLSRLNTALLSWSFELSYKPVQSIHS